MRIEDIDMKVVGNLDCWLTEIYEQPSQFSSKIYDDSTQRMYAEQMLEILNMVKEMYRDYEDEKEHYSIAGIPLFDGE